MADFVTVPRLSEERMSEILDLAQRCYQGDATAEPEFAAVPDAELQVALRVREMRQRAAAVAARSQRPAVSGIEVRGYSRMKASLDGEVIEQAPESVPVRGFGRMKLALVTDAADAG